MRQAQDVINFRTRGQGHHDITPEVKAWVARQDMNTGLLTVFIQHVLASLSIRQHSDRDDLLTFFRRLEGSDDEVVPRPTHLYATQVSIPIRDGALALGTRQGLFLLEQLESPNTRQLVLHLIGD